MTEKNAPEIDLGERAFTVDMGREVDGRWIAEVNELPGVMAYGETEGRAMARALRLAADVVAQGPHPSTNGDRERLLDLLRTRAYHKLDGPVTLASGGASRIYIDARTVTMSAEGASLVGELMLDLIGARVAGPIHAVAGLELGAVPLATAIALASSRREPTLDALAVRKQQKIHGRQKQVEGAGFLPPGARVVVVEDVVTSGASLSTVVGALLKEKLVPVACCALVDREAGAKDLLERRWQLPFHALFTKSELEAG